MVEAPAKRGSFARVHVVRRLRAALAPPTLRPGQRSLSGLPARHAGANTGSDLGSNRSSYRCSNGPKNEEAMQQMVREKGERAREWLVDNECRSKDPSLLLVQVQRLFSVRCPTKQMC